MSKSKIEWTNETWNPFTGCSKISPGCENCYAEKIANRMKFNPNKKVARKYKNGFKPTYHIDCLEEPRKMKPGSRIFVCSMSDLFHEDNHFENIYFVMNEMRLPYNKDKTFIVLTKRPAIMKAYFDYIEKLKSVNIPMLKNLWIGVTVENQKTANERIKILKDIDAVVKFISIEPMLGPISLIEAFNECDVCDGSGQAMSMVCYGGEQFESIGDCPDCSGAEIWIDWVICGGETGPKARPISKSWVENLCEECDTNGIPFFFKSWGEYNSAGEKVGKKLAGNLVFEREYLQIPAVKDGENEVNN